MGNKGVNSLIVFDYIFDILIRPAIELGNILPWSRLLNCVYRLLGEIRREEIDHAIPC